MLSLARRTNEIVEFADAETGRSLGTLTILRQQKNGRVQLGFEMDRRIKILRTELSSGAAAQPPRQGE